MKAVIDLHTGSIAEIYDLLGGRPSRIFTEGDRLLALGAGTLWPQPFTLMDADPTSIVLTSPGFMQGEQRLALSTTVSYRLVRGRLRIDYMFEAHERVELRKGLHINISSSSWDSLLVRNHCSGEPPIAFGCADTVRFFALNQVYELRNKNHRFTMVFPNPYHSLVWVWAMQPHFFLFRYHVLVGTHPFGAFDMHGPPLASVLTPGIKLHRRIELIVSRGEYEADAAMQPIAYLSPFPNGYEQVIAMTFDDIPFRCWRYPTSGHDPDAPMQQYLIRLLEDHPKMKMGWVISPDLIFTRNDLATPGYPPGKWWRAHGTWRVLTEAPEDYRKWIRNIDRNNIIYGYEDRVHLGSHGYHHTPEMEFGPNFEFQYYDPDGHDSTFAVIADEFRLLGLSERSLKWMRFPGFHFTRTTVDALIKYGFVFFDYWHIYNKLPWMLFYSEHGRIWGAGTWWQGDTPCTYDDMDRILRAGRLCHTAGHPGNWFDGDPEEAYKEIHGIFLRAEENFPNLGYMFPDEVGYFADETYDIDNIESEVVDDDLIVRFTGSALRDQTIVVEWPPGEPFPVIAAVDGRPIARVRSDGRCLRIILPLLSEGSHVIRVPFVREYASGPTVRSAAVSLCGNHPNPFNALTTIRYYVPRECRISLEIYDIAGKPVSRLLERHTVPEGLHAITWRGVNDAGDAVASGVYLCRLTAGAETVTRKIILLR
jgi:hypothetical protein